MAEIKAGSFARGDPEWHRLRKKSLDDLYWFADVVLGYGELIPMRDGPHKLLCKMVERKTGSPLLDTARYRKFEMPRETGKTTLITQGYVIQRICKNREVSIMLANEKEQTAKDILAAIKHAFESNELLRALFPEVIPPDLNDTVWSASRIIVNRKSGRKEPTIFVIGVGGTVTGMHPDVIFVDDMISREAMENAKAQSNQIMLQVNRWINQLDPLLKKDGIDPELTFIGTRWWHGDSYEHIDEAFGYKELPRTVLLRTQLENGTVQQVAAQRIGDLAVFRRAAIEDGQSIFPEKWNLEDLGKIRLRDPALFACNYMNNPSDELTSVFKQDWIRPIVWLDDRQFYITQHDTTKKVLNMGDLDTLILVDPGGFAERIEDMRARAAAVLVGDDFKGHKFFLDCYSVQDTYLAAIKKIVEWCGKYAPRKIYVERAGQQAAFAQLLREYIAKAGLKTPVDDTTLKPGSKNKDVRVLEMEPYFQRGEVYVGTGPELGEFREQYSQFPNSARKDVVDVLGYWPSVMRKSPLASGGDTAQRQAKERATYKGRLSAWRRT